MYKCDFLQAYILCYCLLQGGGSSAAVNTGGQANIVVCFQSLRQGREMVFLRNDSSQLQFQLY